MDFLKSHLFTAFLISISYFIIKMIFYRINKNDKITKKMILKDTVLIIIVSYLILVFKDQLFVLDVKKTQIFTGEPSF